MKTDELDFYFNWYIRGPYSPDLAKDLFNINELWSKNRSFLKKIIEKHVHNKAIDKAVDLIKVFESSFKEEFDREWDPEDLEVLASLMFIESNTFTKCRRSKENSIEEFNKRKDELKHKGIERYWNLLETVEFF